MKRIYYRNDFVLKIMPKDLLGNAVDIPQGDFDITFESGNRAYVCSKRGDEYKRCRIQDGALVCVFDNHGLAADVLLVSAIFFSPNAAYPDGMQTEKIEKHALDVELVTTDENSINEYSTEVAMPFAVITAYQMAVNAGYTGTEAEWLEMMKGTNKIDIRQSEGDSATAVMSQKATTEALEERDKKLQAHIDKMRAELLEVELTKTSGADVVLVGVMGTYTVTATCSDVPDSLVIKRGSEELVSVTDTKTATASNSVAVSTRGKLAFTATAKIGEAERTATVEVNVVLPVYIGAGSNEASVYKKANEQSARIEPKGTYTVNVASKGDYVWVLVPDDMTFKGAEMGGFQFPMTQQDSTIDNYNVWRSDMAYKAGDMEIVLL